VGPRFGLDGLGREKNLLVPVEFKKISPKLLQRQQFLFLRATLPNGYKHSYFNNAGTEPLCHLTLGQLVDIAAERRTDREAFVSAYQGLRLTFGEAREQVSLSLIYDTCIDGAVGDRNGPTWWT